MRNVYQHVIQRILLSVSKEDEEVLRKRSEDSSLLVEQTDVWPPWPPWVCPLHYFCCSPVNVISLFHHGAEVVAMTKTMGVRNRSIRRRGYTNLQKK